MTMNYRFLLAGAAFAMSIAQAQVQTKSGISLYYWTYPTSTPGITLPGELPAGEGQPGLAVAVQSSDSTVAAFVVTVNYTANDGSAQTTVHKFTAAASGYTTELFPVGVIQKVTRVSVIPVVAAQEVVFDSGSGGAGDGATESRRPTSSKPK